MLLGGGIYPARGFSPATAHKIAVIFYAMVKNQAEYDQTIWENRNEQPQATARLPAHPVPRQLQFAEPATVVSPNVRITLPLRLSRNTTPEPEIAVNKRPSPAHTIGPSPSNGVRTSPARCPDSPNRTTFGGLHAKICLPPGLQAKS